MIFLGHRESVTNKPQPGDLVTARRMTPLHTEETAIQGVYSHTMGEDMCEVILEDGVTVKCSLKGIVIVPEKNITNAEVLRLARSLVRERYAKLMKDT